MREGNSFPFVCVFTGNFGVQKYSAMCSGNRIIGYIVIYIWQITEGKVPNIDSPDHAGIKAAWHPTPAEVEAVQFQG